MPLIGCLLRRRLDRRLLAREWLRFLLLLRWLELWLLATQVYIDLLGLLRSVWDLYFIAVVIEEVVKQ